MEVSVQNKENNPIPDTKSVSGVAKDVPENSVCDNRTCTIIFDDDTNETKPDIKLDEGNLTRYIYDFTFPIETRIKALDLYFSKNPEDTTEIVNRLGMMYEFSKTKLLKEYLYEICEKSHITPLLKSLLAQILCNAHSDEKSHLLILNIYEQLGDDVGTPYKIELLKLSMFCEPLKEKVQTYLSKILRLETLNCDYRYKIILGLEYKVNKEEKEYTPEELEKIRKREYFIKESCYVFVKDEKNLVAYRILSGQNLLRLLKKWTNIVSKEAHADPKSLRDFSKEAHNNSKKVNSDSKEVNSRYSEETEDILLSIAENESVEYNKRADATDVLLQFGSDRVIEKAKMLIRDLGKVTNNNFTLYDNAQNVHTQEIEDGVKEAIEFLQTFPLLRVNGSPIDFKYVETEIGKLIKDSDITDNKSAEMSNKVNPISRERINLSLNRISMDRALYSKYNCRLVHILLQLWTYISQHKDRDEMLKRLLEELTEMADTCSSGFASRLINVICGFGDFSLRISWQDQISSNFFGRLNVRIRDLDDLDLQEQVLSEMTIDTSKFEERQNFLRFLRENIPELRGELYTEFREHISDTDFDLFFRITLMKYEGEYN